MSNLQVIVIVTITIIWIDISNSVPVKETYQQQNNYNHDLTSKDGNGQEATAKIKDHLEDNVKIDDNNLGQKKQTPNILGQDDNTLGQKATPNILGQEIGDKGTLNLTESRRYLKRKNNNRFRVWNSSPKMSASEKKRVKTTRRSPMLHRLQDDYGISGYKKGPNKRQSTKRKYPKPPRTTRTTKKSDSKDNVNINPNINNNYYENEEGSDSEALYGYKKPLSSYSNSEILSVLHERLNQRDGVPLKGKWGRCRPGNGRPYCRKPSTPRYSKRTRTQRTTTTTKKFDSKDIEIVNINPDINNNFNGNEDSSDSEAPPEY